MLTENLNQSESALPRRRRGRPAGITEQGTASKESLYQTAIEMIADRGYETTTLREVAKKARVSPGLLYRYFPSKRAIVLQLYQELSAEYANRAKEMPAGNWRDRFFYAVSTSLEVLRPHRTTLSALVPVLVGDSEEGLLGAGTKLSGERVHAAFQDAVTNAADSPAAEVTAALGRILYLIHLAIILLWLLDKSPQQRATSVLLGVLKRTLPGMALIARVKRTRPLIVAADRALREALF